MATWVTHLMIADRVLERVSGLHRRGFCVGNIAPDCNVENEDWTCFTPSREVTHWMSEKRKTAADCDRFYQEYIRKRTGDIKTEEQYSFLMGYYAHLIADAEFQRYVRDERRVASAWKRIKKHPILSEKVVGMQEDWDTVKSLIGNEDRMKDIYSIEAAYLKEHPESGYLTEILTLTDFPDYIDYFPHGAIVRKIKIMGYIPEIEISTYPYVAMSEEEYGNFIEEAIKLIIQAFEKNSYLSGRITGITGI